MSSNINDVEHDPVSNLIMQPVRGILKTSKSIEQSQIENNEEMTSSINNYSTTGMKRSESKSHKIPHFDEMNIIATYHPSDKDYGHMKIEEPKTPYASGGNFDEEMETELNNDETTNSGVDPDALTQRLNESSFDPSHLYSYRPSRRSIDENATLSPEELEHRKQFENHRKKHYNEFEVVRLHKKEIEAELRALEQEEATSAGSDEKERCITSSSNDSIKPILVHDPSSHHHQQHHVHVKDDYQQDPNEQLLTPEEQERKKQFELKRKKHYNEFHAAYLADKEDEK